jgi:hypothetical protein
MIERPQDRFGLYSERLAADSARGSAEMLAGSCMTAGIEPHIPVFDKSGRKDGTFERLLTSGARGRVAMTRVAYARATSYA